MLLSFKNALKFSFSMANWFVSFIWSIVNITIFLSFIKVIKSNFTTLVYAYMGDVKSIEKIYTFLKGMYIGYIFYAIVLFVALVYILIVAKRIVYQQSPQISLLFFVKQCAILVPVLVVYVTISCLIFRLCGHWNMHISIPSIACAGLTYLLTAFFIAYMDRFSFSSVRNLFIPALCKPLLILMAWVYIAIYGVVIYFSVKYLTQGTRKILKELMPLVLPCHSWVSILTLIFGAIPVLGLAKVLPKKAKVIFIFSLLYVIPSMVLYSLLKTFGSINFLMFLIIFQILWYEWYFALILINSVQFLLAHLFAESSLRLSGVPDQKQTQN